MTYATLTVLVHGALDIEEDIDDDVVMRERLRKVAEDAAVDGLLTEVYVLQHPHPNDGRECECVQYTTDHHPVHVFNGPGR